MEAYIEVYLAATQAGAEQPSLYALIAEADFILKGVLLLLVAMSVFCWAIIFQKWFRLRAAAQQSSRVLELFWRTKRMDAVYEQSGVFKNSPVAEVFKAGYQELAKVTAGGTGEDAVDNLSRTLRRAAAVESTNLQRYVSFLATTGSTAPFIGLFGTVWGILLAFHELGSASQVSIQVIGPQISHALIATAVGLAAAIPAVMAYNYFNSSLRVLHTEMDTFSADFLNIVKRHLR